MSSVTWADVDEEVMFLAGYPDRQKPNSQVRMSAYLRAARWIIRKAQSAPTTKFVNKFSLSVGSGENEYDVPREDFNGIDSCIADADFYPDEPLREIGVINYSDANLSPYTRGVVSSTGRVRKISVREDFDSTSGEKRRKIVTFPKGATDNLIIIYKVLPDRNAEFADACPLDEQTALGLLPAIAVGKYLYDQFVWNTYADGEDVNTKRDKLLEKCAGMYDMEYEEFEQDIYYPVKAQASQDLQGINSRSRIRRTYRRRR